MAAPEGLLPPPAAFAAASPTPPASASASAAAAASSPASGRTRGFAALAVAGERSAGKGDAAKALQLFLRALAAFAAETSAAGSDPADGRAALAAVHHQTGGCYMALGQYEQAVKHQKQYLALAKAGGDREAEAAAYGALANALRGAGRFEKAIECFQRQLRVAKATSNVAVQCHALEGMGKVYHQLGNDCGFERLTSGPAQPANPEAFNRAILLYRKSFAKRDKAKDPKGLGHASASLGATYEALKEYDRAENLYRQRLQIAEQNDDPVGQSRALTSLGNLHRTRGKFQDAISCYERDLQFVVELGDKSSQAISHSNLGSAYQAFGDVENSILHHKKHLDLVTESRNDTSALGAHANLGALYEYQGNYQRALTHFESCIQLARNVSDQVNEARHMENLARVKGYVEQGMEAVRLERDGVDAPPSAPRAVFKGSLRGMGTISRVLNPRGSVRRSRAMDKAWSGEETMLGMGALELSDMGGGVARSSKNPNDFNSIRAKRWLRRNRKSTADKGDGELGLESDASVSDGEDATVQLRLGSIRRVRNRLSSLFRRPNEGGSGSDVESPRISVTNIDLLSGREAATGRGGARSSRRRKLLVDALGDLDDLDSGHSDTDPPRRETPASSASAPASASASATPTTATSTGSASVNRGDAVPLRVRVKPSPRPSPLANRRGADEASADDASADDAHAAVAPLPPPGFGAAIDSAPKPDIAETSADLAAVDGDTPEAQLMAAILNFDTVIKSAEASIPATPPSQRAEKPAAEKPPRSPLLRPAYRSRLTKTSVAPHAGTPTAPPAGPPVRAAGPAGRTAKPPPPLSVPVHLSVPPPLSAAEAAAAGDKADQKHLAVAARQVSLVPSPNTRQAWLSNSTEAYEAQYKYRAQDDDELSFEAGDILLHCKRIDEGWMYGECERTRKSGLIPANYVRAQQVTSPVRTTMGEAEA